ncbi:NAD-dependent epimerase/dehydratase family protein [Parablautia muri]|uniref:NAD(P)-dependent oxidoreductase n=1 Tax=Parablautia muri TaxID=2320879 RepID=A0A9X5BEX7_9FIRM|nr:NAD(P)-dependent oxidoreductase [Parablautia muri]NBJ92538.1 NAD(P)-dependent oxidoreductase [Parablautia muri]
MRNVIISGAAGFIGNAVVRQLISQGVSVVAVVKPETTMSEDAFRLNGLNIPVIECDLKEMEKLPRLIDGRNYDVFYQFAWDGLSKEALLNYKTQIDNITWTMKSIEAAAALNCKKYIGAGSYTQMELLYQKGRFFTEDRHKYYRVAQLASETMGRAVAKELGIQFLWPIIINVYGEGEIAPRLVNNMIKNLLERRHQAFSHGNQMYDFLHIKDAAKAFCLIGEKGIEKSQYIIGSGKAKPLKDYLEIIRNIVAPEMQLGLGELEFHGLEMTREMLDISSLVNDTGFTPAVTFEAGIKRTFEWIKKEDNRILDE